MLDGRARAELLAIFQAELGEHCQTLTRAFLALEKEPGPAEQQELLDEAFRAAHSLKGAARSVGLGSIEALAHAVEDVLAAAKRDERELSPPLFDLLYAALDTLSGGPGIGGKPAVPEDLIRRLAEARAGRLPKSAPSEAAAVAASVPDETPTAPAPALPRPSPTTAPSALGGTGETVRLPAARVDALLEQLGELLVPRLEVAEGLAVLAAVLGGVEGWQREWRKLRPLLRHLERTGMPADLRPLVRFLERNEDNLASLGSNLGALHARLAAPTAALGSLTDDLQAEVKRFRMLPFGGLTAGFERAVRDLARSLGKEARLIVVGADTELDRRVLEEMKDPLLHLLRNAVHHGIEPPAERKRLGKPTIGSVVVAASQRGGTVVIEVEDDGGGLDPGTIRRAAAERGLLSQSELAATADRELLRLIFLPGFSTSGDVSEVSGRGVGLDVVARAVERLSGRVDVEPTPGHGTRFVITLPLTLAATRALLVEAEGALYAMPIAAVEHVVRTEQFGSLGGRPMLERDGVGIPVAALAELLGGRVDRTLPSGSPQILALVAVGSRRVALAIDRIVGEQEIVVKPLPYPLLRVRFVAGATILGSGRVVAILKAADLVRAASQPGVAAAAPGPRGPEQQRPRVMVAEDSLTTRTLERYILEAAGYEVELAGDGAEALSLLQERGCDVLVSDVNMPELDGIALTERVRQDPRFRELPVILVTSLDSPEDRERGLEAGADAYLVKSSFDQDQLLRTIRELL